MAHELTIRADSTAEMAYAGEQAWHGLGQQLTAGAPIESWIEAAGMDWKIARSRVRFGTGPNQQTMDSRHVLFRSDTKAPLGIVSPQFKIVQPREVLEFFRDLTEGAGFQLETAGTLFGGKRFWALANIGESAVIGSADVVGGYLLLSTGADGSLATTAKFTTVRVVCNNTLSMALSARDKRDVSVTHRTEFDHGKVKDRLGIARGEFNKFISAMRDLSKVRLTAGDVETLTVNLVNGGLISGATTADRQAAEDKVLASKPYQSILGLFNGAGKGSTLQGAAGTAWGWVNAVTEHVDHHAAARSDDNRISSAWFDKGDALKTRAVELALAQV